MTRQHTRCPYPAYTIEEFTSLLSINSIGLLRDFIGVVIAIAVIVGFIVVSMGDVYRSSSGSDRAYP
jgi:hypothetical protein